MADAGGTRKVVYLTGVPGNLVINFKTYFIGLHARIAWRQSGYGNQSLSHLIDIARRITDVSFVVSVLMLNDILCNIIRPFALKVQAAVEPWYIEHASDQLFSEITRALENMQHVQNMLCAIVLCCQHIGQLELGKFLQAMQFSTTAKNLPQLIL